MKVFGFVKKVFFVGLTILSSFTKASSLSCISVNNQACKAIPQIVNVNSNNPIIYPFSTALRCGSFLEKILKKSTCAIMIRIIVTFANQIFLKLIWL